MRLCGLLPPLAKHKNLMYLKARPRRFLRDSGRTVILFDRRRRGPIRLDGANEQRWPVAACRPEQPLGKARCNDGYEPASGRLRSLP